MNNGLVSNFSQADGGANVRLPQHNSQAMRL
jgi:hypothetical protein